MHIEDDDDDDDSQGGQDDEVPLSERFKTAGGGGEAAGGGSEGTRADATAAEDVDLEEERRRADDLRRKREAEVARQAAEKAAEARRQREQAAMEARRAKTKKAQKEMMEELRRKQEEDTFQREHQARRAQAEAKVRENARGACVATATDEIYEKHLAAFERLTKAEPGSLREVDIPWPQPHNMVFLTPRDNAAAKKTKIVKALQRWHPDKFSQRFGSLLRPDESERILARVKTVSQTIIELRQIFN